MNSQWTQKLNMPKGRWVHSTNLSPETNVSGRWFIDNLGDLRCMSDYSMMPDKTLVTWWFFPDETIEEPRSLHNTASGDLGVAIQARARAEDAIARAWTAITVAIVATCIAAVSLIITMMV